jgi:hypothetical protein
MNLWVAETWAYACPAKLITAKLINSQYMHYFPRSLEGKLKNRAVKKDLWKSMIHCFKKCSVMAPEKCGVEFEVPV